jgi:hypothetical protein
MSIRTLPVISADGVFRSTPPITDTNVVQPRSNPHDVNVDLFLLGVPSDYHERTPRAAMFPERFNDNALFIWEGIFRDSETVNYMKSRASTSEQWDVVVKEFLKRCRASEINPFDDDSSSASNGRLMTYLSAARRKIVHHLEKMMIFDHFSVKNVSREFITGDSSLTIKVKARLIRIPDVTDFIKFITSSEIGFRATTGGRYMKIVDAGSRIYIKAPSPANAFIEYEVRGPTKAEYPLTEKSISKKKYREFVLHKIWLPVVRANKFKTKRPTLF